MAVNKKSGRRTSRAAPRSGRRQHLDETTVVRITEVIKAWPELPLRWEDLVAMLQHRGIGSWTRQALSAKSDIVDAVKARKIVLAGTSRRRTRDPEIIVLRRQLHDLEERMKQLSERNTWYEERHLIMLRNASVRGLTEADLMKPLPPIDRSTF